MHGLIREHLEEALQGAPGGQTSDEVARHLSGCEACRDEVSGMREQNRVLRSLRPEDPPEAAPGFYARVLERIEAQRGSSMWSAFLDPIFDRRVVATSLALSVLLGGFLAFSEARVAPPPASAEAIMEMQDRSPGLGQNRQRDRDTMLVALATYRE
jgi:anti-sigma factor RsiW